LRRPDTCSMQRPSRPHPPAEASASERGAERPTTGALVPLGSFLHPEILATSIESCGEPVEIEKLAEETVTAPVPEWADLPAGTTLVRRTVLVRGAQSPAIFLHAGSLLVLDRLDPSFPG